MKLHHIITALLLLLLSSPTLANTPLVSPKWLNSNLDRADLVVLDLQPKASYAKYHIPGAVNSLYANWRKTDKNGVPKMLPKVSQLEKMIGDLGINNSTHVVLVVTGRGAGEMASATRLYWTFKVLGHDRVSILDGGLIAYAQNRSHLLEKGVTRPEKKHFKASLREEQLVTARQIKAGLGKEITLVDSRSGAEYMGLIGGGGKERPGTLPGSVNLPYDWLTVNGGATFHSIDNLREIYEVTGTPLEGRQISFCHTGHRTSLSWFVSHELLGNREARLYDGSTVEWAVNPTLPVEQKVSLGK